MQMRNTRASLTGSSSSSSAISCVQQCDQVRVALPTKVLPARRQAGSGGVRKSLCQALERGGARNGLVRAGSMTVGIRIAANSQQAASILMEEMQMDAGWCQVGCKPGSDRGGGQLCRGQGTCDMMPRLLTCCCCSCCAACNNSTQRSSQ